MSNIETQIFTPFGSDQDISKVCPWSPELLCRLELESSSETSFHIKTLAWFPPPLNLFFNGFSWKHVLINLFHITPI